MAQEEQVGQEYLLAKPASQPEQLLERRLDQEPHRRRLPRQRQLLRHLRRHRRQLLRLPYQKGSETAVGAVRLLSHGLLLFGPLW